MRRAFAIPALQLSRSIPGLAAAALLAIVAAGGLRAAPEEAGFKTLKGEISDAFKTKRQVNSRRLQALSILRGTTPLAGNETAFDEYFTNYLFPSWTLTSVESLGELAKDREQFLSSDLGRAAPAPHDRLVELAFKSMVPIAQDPEFHPGVRYNAVLVLGGLNAKESDRVNKANPEPLSKALDILLQLYANPEEADAVRVGALLGLVRHLEWDEFRKQTPKMAADKKAAVVSELLALAGATKPPAGRSVEGHTWMRRRALEGLMYASPAGQPTAEVAELILKIVASDEEPVSLRCTAADIMGRLDYQAPATPAAEPSARELGHLALVACDAELTRLEDERNQAKFRSQSQSPYGGIGVGGGGNLPPATTPGAALPGAGSGGGPPSGMSMPGVGGPGGGGAPDPTSMMGGMMGGMMGPKAKGKRSKSRQKANTKVADLLAGGASGAAGLKTEKKDEQLEYIRRRMRAWLYAVQMGLGDETANPENSVKRSGFGAKATMTESFERGVIAYAAAPQDAYVKEVIAQVQKVVSVVEAPDLDGEEFVEGLRSEMDALADMTKPLKKEKADEEPLAPGADVPGGDVPGPPAEAASTSEEAAAAAADATGEIPGAAPTAPAADGKAAPPVKGPAPAAGKSP